MHSKSSDRNHVNTQLADKLEAAGVRSPRGGRPSSNMKVKPMKSPTEWKGDGDDHVNIWSKGITRLGRSLDPRSPLRFTHSLFGPFISVRNFWTWLGSEERDDRIRTMGIRDLIDFAKLLTQKQVTNYKAIVMDAHYQRIKAHPPVREDLKNLTLPLDMYTVNESGMPRRSGDFAWMLDGFNEIRKALKENREPDFKFLMDDPDKELLHYELAKYRSLADQRKRFEEESQPPEAPAVVEAPKVEPAAPKKSRKDMQAELIRITTNEAQADAQVVCEHLALQQVKDGVTVTMPLLFADPTISIWIQNALKMVPGQIYNLVRRQDLMVQVEVEIGESVKVQHTFPMDFRSFIVGRAVKAKRATDMLSDLSYNIQVAEPVPEGCEETWTPADWAFYKLFQDAKITIVGKFKIVELLKVQGVEAQTGEDDVKLRSDIVNPTSGQAWTTDTTTGEREQVGTVEATVALNPADPDPKATVDAATQALKDHIHDTTGDKMYPGTVKAFDEAPVAKTPLMSDEDWDEITRGRTMSRGDVAAGQQQAS